MTLLLLDTSTGLCRLTLVCDGKRSSYEWQADRSLARDLLAYARDRLAEHDMTFADIDGLGVYRGPGSFTGLRIGMTVLDTLADSLGVPIVGETGDDWQERAIQRLNAHENDHLVLPLYGRDANVTKPRK